MNLQEAIEDPEKREAEWLRIYRTNSSIYATFRALKHYHPNMPDAEVFKILLIQTAERLEQVFTYCKEQEARRPIQFVVKE